MVLYMMKIFKLYIRGVDSKELLGLLRESKYVQSDLKDIFGEIISNLNIGKFVLFVGTPCQCNGLRNLLRKDYDKLIICDLVCYGVPSPMIFDNFLDYIRTKYASDISYYTFRNKRLGWSIGKSDIKLSNGKNVDYIDTHIFDELFWSNLILRKSCYHCQYHDVMRIGDFTIGDFWGIELINPALNDEKGISLMLINTEKAIKFFEEIKDNIIFGETSIDVAIAKQDRLKNSVNILCDERKLFWEFYSNNGFRGIMKKYTSNNSKQRFKYVLKRLIKSIIN